MHSPLRISFDLDDTLIVYGEQRPCDPCLVPRLLRPFFREPLRQGSRDLLCKLHDRGVEIWVYTTSRRSERSLRLWWRLNRLPRLSGFTNQMHHEKEMRRIGHAKPPTKLPGHWHIDLHVDDSEGVRLEQPSNHAVQIVVVSPTDGNWASRVLEIVDRELLARQQPLSERHLP